MKPTNRDLYELLTQLLEGQQALSKQMADLATDLQNLVAAVSSVTTDVQQVLTLLASAGNLTADQVTQLEAQIAALQQLDSTVKAALPPGATTTAAKRH